ncbi:MAG: adenylate/guanylate cyclase domain-containing protein [Alphaproteobacteria bacterium]
MWGGTYLVIFGAGLTAALPLFFSLIVGSSLVVAHLTRNHIIAIYSQITCILYVTTFIQWSIGSVFDSGFVMVWAFLAPLIALMYLSLAQSVAWLALYLVNIVLSVVFSDFFVAHGQQVSEQMQATFYVMNLSIAAIVVFGFASYFVRSAMNEKAKADRLLLNILPAKTARALKAGEGAIAEEYPDVSVLFADIVNYTEYSSDREPSDLVAKLDEIFLCFDEAATRHGLEKIKTIGDAYMVVGGLPEPMEHHDRAVAAMALDMMTAISTIRKTDGTHFALRIGIHAGPVVAGVIGKSKFAYDLWGDTVNVASRLESHGAAGRIQVSSGLHGRLKDAFAFERRGVITIKGKGDLEAFYLIGRAEVGHS